MKSVYACFKGEVLALAFDIYAINDPKVIGALLKLAGESELLVDRVERDAVVFEDPVLIRQARAEKAQLELDFNKPPAGDGGGPSEMPEGFTCTFSGPCPNEGKPCATCEHASNGIPKAETPAVESVLVEVPGEIPQEVRDMFPGQEIHTFDIQNGVSEERAAALDEARTEAEYLDAVNDQVHANMVAETEGVEDQADYPSEDVEPDDLPQEEDDA